MSNDKNKTVWSSEDGDVRKQDRSSSGGISLPPQQQTVYLHRESSGRGGKAVSLNRAQCTKNNPELMQDCFSKIRQNLQNLLEGNGNLTKTAKTIKGGPSTTPFVVSCNGLNGCVTAFKNVRDQQKTYIRDVQKKKEAYAG